MRRLVIVSVACALALVSASCAKKPRNYDTKVTLRGVEVIARDATTGNPTLIEINVEYPDCPGEQLETLQGNAEFSKCAQKYKPGDIIPTTVEWGPTDFGHYDSEITKLGDCLRARDPRDARSYEVVQVCTDVVVNGAKAGFHCDRKPNKELLEKCPWFARQ
jgi:hypothetical protein